jgi:hypothetical protein
MQKRNLFIRIVAIALCAIMILSVVSAALYVFAADVSTVASPDTGSPDGTTTVIAVVAAVAVLIVVACLVIPKLKK